MEDRKRNPGFESGGLAGLEDEVGGAVEAAGVGQVILDCEAFSFQVATDDQVADFWAKQIAATESQSQLDDVTKLLKELDEDPAELIKKVASKGGTTEAAFKVFDRKKFKSIIKEAASEAAKRAKKLSKG